MKLPDQFNTLLSSISREVLTEDSFQIIEKPAIDNSVVIKSGISDLSSIPVEVFYSKDTSPLPHACDRVFYNRNNDFAYWCLGLQDYLRMNLIAKKYLNEFPNTYLDFGCASGRVVRHVAFQSECKNIYCVDINERNIKWILKYLPNKVVPIHTSILPHLPFEDNYFDFISSFSVFTHIFVFETTWLAELRRILKPNGIAYVTLQMGASLEEWRTNIVKNRPRLAMNERFLTSKFDTKEVFIDDAINGKFINAQTFHPENYVRDLFGRFFKIEEIIHGWHGSAKQSVVVLRKI